jgi:hypothetical protein
VAAGSYSRSADHREDDLLIFALCLIAFLGVIAIMLRVTAAGSLTSAERYYLLTTPLPFVLAILLPGPIAMLVKGSSARAWGLRLNGVGGWLSVVLVGVGLVLVWRRWARGQDRERRLTAGLVLAAIPAVLIGLVGLQYLVLR